MAHKSGGQFDAETLRQLWNQATPCFRGSKVRRTPRNLGSWDPQVLQYRERLKAKAVSSPAYEAVSQPLYTSAIGRWENYRKQLEPCLEILQPCLNAFGYAL